MYIRYTSVTSFMSDHSHFYQALLRRRCTTNINNLYCTFKSKCKILLNIFKSHAAILQVCNKKVEGKAGSSRNENKNLNSLDVTLQYNSELGIKLISTSSSAYKILRKVVNINTLRWLLSLY